MIMDEKNYDCKNDLEFKKVMENDFSKDTIESYRTSINMFCRINKKSYSDIISEIRDEQFDRIEDNRIIRYNPNQGKVALYCNNLINYYLEKGSSKQTIHSRLNHIRSMLKKSGIILPQKPKIAINNEIETIISRKDIQSIFKFCSIWRKAQISFLAVIYTSKEWIGKDVSIIPVPIDVSDRLIEKCYDDENDCYEITIESKWIINKTVNDGGKIGRIYVPKHLLGLDCILIESPILDNF